jgi:calcineurin-like phosphoesterase family protein
LTVAAAEFLVQWLNERRKPPLADQAPARPQPASTQAHPIRIACISDTHNTQPTVPDGNILLHAGDLTNNGTFEELQAQLRWLSSLPHRHKLVIAGNHDRLLDADYVARFPDRTYEGPGTSRSDLDWGDITYLNDSSVTLHHLPGDRTLSIYGSPLTEQCGTFAFQYPPVREGVWDRRVPDGTDVLLVHGPPRGYLDGGGKGCPQLAREVWRVRPRLVVFGHIHIGYGRQILRYDDVAEAAYASVLMRAVTSAWGLLAVSAMAWHVFWQKLVQTLVPSFERASSPLDSVLINAALMGAKHDGGTKEPFVVEV